MSSGRVAVTGANSAVGRALLARLAGEETLRVAAGVRRPQALAGLPQSPRIAARLIDYDSADSLRALLDGADCVVHLAGVLFESPSSRYRSANVDTTRALVDAARDAGVGRIVFVSSLGANPRSSNGYYRSKGQAERVVARAGAGAAIIRTPLLLGPGTAGGRALLRDASRGSVRVLGGGVHLLRPLDVDDLCSAILHCCAQPAGGARTYQLVAVAEGYRLTDLPVRRAGPVGGARTYELVGPTTLGGARTYELVGPTTLSQRDLLQRAARLLDNDPTVRTMPIGLAKLAARCAGLLRTGGLTPAVIDVITSDETVRRNADADLGVELTPLTDTLARLVEASKAT